MEIDIFKKMKVKPNTIGIVINKPDEYPIDDLNFELVAEGDKLDFVHLFVNSKEQFMNLINDAKQKCKPNGLLWISYRKGNNKIKYDINRDILWDLSLLYDLHPVAQIALNETWSAIRLLKHDNEERNKYIRPINF